MPLLGTLADVRDVFIIVYGALGIIFFLVGLGVSLIKGGQVRRIRRRLMKFHFMMRHRFGRT